MNKNILFVSIFLIILWSLTACQKEKTIVKTYPVSSLDGLFGLHNGYETYRYTRPYVPPKVQDSIPLKELHIIPIGDYSIKVIGLDSTKILDFDKELDSLVIFKNYISDYVYSTMVFELTWNKNSQKASYYYHFGYATTGTHHATTRKFYEY